jgi:uncharacterized membrane protein
MTKPEGPVGVFVASFDSEDLADKALKSIEELQSRALMLTVFDHAKVVRDKDGRIEVRPAHGARGGAKTGLVVGAIVGVIFPPSLIVTGAAGAAAGAAVGKARKGAFDRDFLERMGGSMEPGRTAIVVITAAQHMETLADSVPGAVHTFSHTFGEMDADAVKEWISSIPSEASEGGEGSS